MLTINRNRNKHPRIQTCISRISFLRGGGGRGLYYQSFLFQQLEVLRRTKCLLSSDTTQTAQKTTRPTILLLLRIRCRGNVFSEPLPSNDMWKHIQTRRFMKYAVEMGSGATIYITSFIRIASSIQKLTWRGYTDTQTAWWSHKSTFIFWRLGKAKNCQCTSAYYSV
jgi:hypothetical protein